MQLGGRLGITPEHLSPLPPTPNAKLAATTPNYKSLLLALTALLSAYLLWTYAAISKPNSSRSTNHMSSETDNAPAQGWHARALRPHPSAASFVPTHDALVFLALLNAPADPEGFTMALFEPNIAVDASGRVLAVQAPDFARLVELAREAAQLPDTGSFMNAWRVAHDRTSQKIDRLFVKIPGGALRQTSVQGWHPQKQQLKAAVAGHEELPPVLQELVKDIQEARTDYVRGQVENTGLVAQIKALADN